jgi:hypothetical protein
MRRSNFSESEVIAVADARVMVQQDRNPGCRDRALRPALDDALGT